ncbi:siderophore biosynthesis protein [Colletotrichum tofieldiae]|nr:siderophore biosynthesis protein [Colletotrichum tofieldiae]GKT80378.1 siderophore biosynthesis protein [Colletotrichum tofieldiae]
MSRYLLPVLAATAVLAKTEMEGCTSFTSTVTVRPSPGYGNTYETIIWYVPDTLEICAGVDCGGGRAPPRKVPGCPAYSGAETVTASFLAATPTAAPTVFSTMTSKTYESEESTNASAKPTRTSTVIKFVTTTVVTAEGKSTSGTKHESHSQAEEESGSTDGVLVIDGATTVTGAAATTTTAAAGASGTQNGAEGVTSTEVPAGAGPTARAGAAAILGIAAAVVALA